MIPEVEPNVRCRAGEARITVAGALPVCWVIHAVAPVFPAYSIDNAQQLLCSAYGASLDLAILKGLHAVAFPALGCGLFSCPVELSAQAAFAALAHRNMSVPDELHSLEVHFVLFKRKELDMWLHEAHLACGSTLDESDELTWETQVQIDHHLSARQCSREQFLNHK